MLIGLVAASFFIPESFFTIWAYIAIVFGIIFLLVQTIMLLEFAYSFADKMLNNYEESHDPCWKIALVRMSRNIKLCRILRLFMTVFV